MRVYINHATRSKRLDNLSDLNISTNNKKVINIKKDDNGVFIPSNLKRDEGVLFATKNFDLAIDTLHGMKQLHGAGTVVYQEITDGHV